MLISFDWFQLLVYIALGVTFFSPLVLLALLFKDLKNEELW